MSNLPANPNYHVTPAVDKENKTPTFKMSKFNYDGYQPGNKVEFSVTVNDSTKEIASVTGTNVTIDNLDGTYSFTMPSSHVDLAVTLKDKGSGGNEPPITPVIKEGYKQVKNLDELIDGAQVIIGTTGDFKRQVAISTTQNANNREPIAMNYNDGYFSVSTDPAQEVQLAVFTISQVSYNDKTYYQFFDTVNNGYLYVCSNNYNYLRTQAENNEKGYFEITNNNGVMEIKASASGYSRNIIGNTANNFIGCGGGTTQTTIDLAIYSDVVETTKAWAKSCLKIDDASFVPESSEFATLFSIAKITLINMGIDYVNALKISEDSTLISAVTRYEEWAVSNNDEDPYNGLIEYVSPLINPIEKDGGCSGSIASTSLIISIFSSIGLGLLLSKKQKHCN